MSRSLTAVNLDGPAALRAVASAFAHVEDFGTFVRGLQSALDRSQIFERAQIQLDRTFTEPATHFSPGAISLPLVRDGVQHGTLQVAPGAEHRQFGAEDLHLMAGLADFLSAILGQALRSEDAAKTRELFRLLLNQAPVGIAAFTSDARPLIANDLANRWLGDALPPFAELEAGDGGFHLRAGGKLIYGEGRRTAPEPAASNWLIVLHDLTGEQVKLLELMKRETYRALTEQRPFGFALIEGGKGDGVLRRLTALRGMLREGEFTGPYDAHRVGLVLSGYGGLALRARLRELRAAFAPGEALRLGYAQLGRDGRAPEALLQAALQRSGGFDELLKPAILIHDETRAVVESLALVVGRDYRLVSSQSVSRSRQLLESESFEAIITEWDARDCGGAEDVVRCAHAMQPGIRTIFTTVQPASEIDAGQAALVIEKPFDVENLAAQVRAALPA
jgi:hypothetical protein